MSVPSFSRLPAEMFEYEYRAQRNPAWFSLVLPHEEPSWFRGKWKWRRRHERIRDLEQQLGILTGIGTYRLPWERIGW